MRAVAILGPRASPRDLARFQSAGADITVAESVQDQPDAAMIFGGDGTVHHQLAALAESQVPLLVVPKGSGNDFAHALGIRSEADALRAWRAFCDAGRNVRQIDLGVIKSTAFAASPARDWRPATGDFFCCVAGAGLDSEANRRANAMPQWLRARGGYAIGVLGALIRFKPHVIRVTLAQSAGTTRTVEEPATMVAFTNAPSYGRGMRIAPRAQLDDGLLDVCFVRQVSRLRLLRLFPRVYSGTHLEMPEVEYAQTARLTIESVPPLDVYADGERICVTPVEVTVAPRALRGICNL